MTNVVEFKPGLRYRNADITPLRDIYEIQTDNYKTIIRDMRQNIKYQQRCFQALTVFLCTLIVALSLALIIVLDS